MNTPDSRQIRRIRRQLTRWYGTHRRRLPWRETRDPYCIWVSEVMLQQTQVKTVIPYYRRFVKRFPGVVALAGADLQEVLKLWEGLGYYSRARNFHRAAGTVAHECNGIVPDSYDAFKQLMGVGDYIASAVMSIAHGQNHAVVDGNVKRVLARIYEMEEPVNLPASHSRFKRLAQALLDTADPGGFNQAVMELGALVCKPRNPDCDHCPIRESCGAWHGGTVVQYPRRLKRAKVPQYRIAVGIVRKNGRLLITRRKPQGLLGGLWEFPGGKIKEGETPEAACIREIREETGLGIAVVSQLTRVRHAYTHFKIEMDVFICDYRTGRVKLKGPDAYRWIGIAQLNRYPFPGANHKFFPLLKQQLGQGPVGTV